MSALPSQRDARAEAKRLRDPADRLVPLNIAAVALDLSEGHLRRRCQNDPELKRFARQVNGRWMIDRAYDERLADACEGMADAEQLASDELSRMPGKRREKAIQRAVILMRFRRWRRREDVVVNDHFELFAKAIESDYGVSPTRRSVYRWDEKAAALSGINAIAVQLADGHRGQRSGHCSDDAWALFCELYLDPRKWSVSKCYKIVAKEADKHGWGWPSKRSIELKAKSEIPAQTRTLRREGAKAMERDFVAPMQQDPEAFAVGERWESDHSMFDFFARRFSQGQWRPVRLWLTAWMDWRSRALVGWHVSDGPNTSTIKLALLRALKDGFSVPTIAWLDHGKDYESAALYGLTKDEKRKITQAGEWWGKSVKGHGLLGRLGIEPHFAIPYNHNGKARIERMFGTMHMDFDREFPSFCGNRKDTVDPDALKAATEDVMSLPTIDEIRERFALWAESYNSTRSHTVADLADRESGELLSRIEFYHRRLPVVRTLNDPNVLCLLEQEWSRPMTVSKHGVSVKFGGGVVRYGSTAPELEPFKGTDRKVVITFDPEDTREISVFTTDYRFVCRARENDTFGGIGKISAEARRAAFSKRKNQRKAAKNWKPESTSGTTVNEISLDAQRQLEIDETKARLAEQGHDPDTLPPIRPVFTPLDGEHDEIEKREQRVAAGAEEFSEDACNDRLIDILAKSAAPSACRDECDEDEDDDGLLSSLYDSRVIDAETDDEDETTPSYSIVDAIEQRELQRTLTIYRDVGDAPDLHTGIEHAPRVLEAAMTTDGQSEHGCDSAKPGETQCRQETP